MAVQHLSFILSRQEWICRDEDAAAKMSRIAQQREDALKRADAHAAEELIRAREHERQQAAKARYVFELTTTAQTWGPCLSSTIVPLRRPP